MKNSEEDYLEPLINSEHLEMLSNAIGQDKFELLVDTFIEELEFLEVEITAKKHNLRKLERVAHQLKGASANLDCVRLKLRAALVERLCKEQVGHELEKQISDLLTCISETRDAFCQ